MLSPNAMNPGIGDAGELWFASQLPIDWVWQPPRRDVGKDGLIVIKDGTDLHNHEFSVQIKATRRPHFDKGTVRCSSIPTASVMYWLSSPQPTLVVVVDIANKRGWYSWHLDLFASSGDITGKQTCSVRLPIRNTLDAEGWARIRERLRDHYLTLHRAPPFPQQGSVAHDSHLLKGDSLQRFINYRLHVAIERPAQSPLAPPRYS